MDLHTLHRLRIVRNIQKRKMLKRRSRNVYVVIKILTMNQGGTPNNSPPPICAGILKQSMGARNRVGIGLSYRHARTRICKLLRAKESIPGFLKRLQIGATDSCANV
jgi:hypothetical protein